MDQLCDDQIGKLLLEAEQRLQSAPNAAALIASGGSKKAVDVVANPAPTTSVTSKEKLAVRSASKPDFSTQKKDSAGNNWFNMPRTSSTSEMKRDWQILRMRNILDPKHQRKQLASELPKYSQVGEIIAGPTEYYSARLTRKERKSTLLEEAMSTRDEVKMGVKYAGIQKKKASGKKAFYQKLVQQRRKGNT